jgi:UDP-N-acetylmuramyl pentapeptide phosphotransferase/UDP-N-acetylglucosamine-1-phosphate transferase
MIEIIGAGLFAAGAAWALVAVLARFAPRIGLVDRPNERSLHSRVTPRGGGIAIVGVALAFVGAIVVWGGSGAPAQRLPLWTYLLTALFIALVSLWDDFRSLGAGLRILCHVAAAAFAVWGLGHFEAIRLSGVSVDLAAWLGGALTIVWIVGLTNAYNFMDGIDGIAAVQGVVAGLAWAVAGASLGSDVILPFGLVLTGVCFGFLLLNWSPARIFMGDVGSAFLGFTFAVLPLLLIRELPRLANAVNPGIVPGFAVLVVWPFIGDGLLTFFRRALRGERVWQAHRSHLYQRLVQTGWSHARVSLLYGGWCVVSALAGFVWLRQAPGAALVATATPMLTLVGMFAFVSWRDKQVADGACESEGESEEQIRKR